MHPGGLPAGPPLPGVVQTVAWGVRPLRFFGAGRRRYGPTFTMRFYDGTPIVVVSEPDDILALFALGASVFGADDGPRVDRLRKALATCPAESSGSVFVLLPPFRRYLGRRSPWGKFVRQRGAVHGEVLGLIAERRASSDLAKRNDILAALL